MAQLNCENLSLSVGQSNTQQILVHALQADFNAGEVICLLGQNGSGKTHLLHALAGLIKPANGSIHLNSRSLDSLSRKTIAQHLGLVTQAHEDPFSMSVFEHTLSGRHPYLGLLDWESAHDKQLAESALKRVGLYDKREQDIQSLSGGERKRLAIARILTQDPDIILWDEPTNHLDPAHQKQTIQLITELQAQGKTQVIALHDVNHAARIATHIIYLMDDGHWSSGEVNEMLNTDALRAVYHTDFHQLESDNGRFFVVG